MTPGKSAIPIREFFSIGDVCEITDLKPHVLRYWESQFKFLHPAKNRSGNRVYQRREVELIMLVKQLLYVEKYTIDGARQRVDEYKKAGELKALARAALDSQTVASLDRDLTNILALLNGASLDALELPLDGQDGDMGDVESLAEPPMEQGIAE